MYQKQFEALEALSPKNILFSEAAISLFSSHKNRYHDILPFEHSRVRLQTLDSTEGSDYINANFILNKKYISCQAPIFSTFADHWRMIWETRCSLIVMLTKLFEGGRTKAHIYWPNYIGTPLIMGDITITKLEEIEDTHFVMRRFRLSKGTEVREIFHLHDTEWPDFGVPHSTKGILKLVEYVNNLQTNSSSQGPIVVHCSAGIGRSASFIAIHHALNQFDFSTENFLPKISEIILDMRKDRVGMVQTVKQFAFIHQAISDFRTQQRSFPGKIPDLSASLDDLTTPQLRYPTDFHRDRASWRYISSDSVPIFSPSASVVS